MRAGTTIGVFLMAVVPVTASATVDYAISAGVGTTDNITLVPVNEKSETMGTVGLELDLDQESTRLKTEITTDLTYLDYLDDTYESEVTGRFDGLARFALLPERIFWVLQENFGQAQLDAFAAPTPTNRESINYLSTGPDFDFRLGSSTFVNLIGRYSNINYEISELDGERFLGGLAVGRELSSSATLSLNANAERYEFKNTLVNTDYDLASAYVRYELHGARTDFSVNLGGSEIDDGTKESGLLAQLELTRRMSSASTLTLSAGSQFTDGADAFRNTTPGASGSGTTVPPIQTSSAFERRHVGLTWRYSRNRTTLDVSARRSDDVYDSDPALDLDLSNFQANVSRQIGRRLTARLFGSVIEYDYVNAGSDYTENRLGAGLDIRMGRNFEFRLDYEHNERDVANAGNPYDENRGFLTLAYRPQSQ